MGVDSRKDTEYRKCRACGHVGKAWGLMCPSCGFTRGSLPCDQDGKLLTEKPKAPWEAS